MGLSGTTNLPFRVVALSRALSICFPLPLFQINYHSFEEDRPKKFYTQIIILQNEHLGVQKL